jgi:hypothetical protein
MKVLDLMKKLAGDTVGADDEVVLEAPNHEYCSVSRVTVETAFMGFKSKTLYEDYGNENKLDPRDRRVRVVVLE